MNPCEVTVHAQKKKKKRQKTWTQQNARKRASQTLTLLPFSDYGTKTVLNPEAVEEKGSEETAYPKPVLSELGF